MSEVKVPITTTYNDKGAKQARDDLTRFTKAAKSSTRQAGDALGRFTKGADEATGSVGSLKDQFVSFAAGGAVALIAKEVGEFAIQSFQAAEAAKVASSAFTNLSGSSAIANINMEAMGRATRGLISDTEQMQIANQLLGMRIVETDAELEKAVSVSRRLGKEFRGLGTRQAAEEFAIMISNMSVQRLDSFGISSGRVKKRIDELLESTEGMTREQAFFQATMEEADDTMSRLGPEVATTADEVNRLKGEWANFQVVLGQTIDDSGVVKQFFSSLTDSLILMRGALGDDSVKVDELKVKIESLTQLIEEPGAAGFAFDTKALEKQRSEFVAELAELEAQQAKIAEQGQAEQAQLQAAIRSEEIANENVAKRKAAAETLANVQREFAEDTLQLQQDIQDQQASAKEKFNDDSIEAEKKHLKSLNDLRERAADDEKKITTRLKKDLAKLDKDTRKRLTRSQDKEDKRVLKTRREFAKDDRTKGKRKQIDTLADERLFQFELRNLAADGEAIAIEQAKERRAIEQEIASEKADFEKTVESDKREEQIKSIRQEGQERRTQLQADTSERRTELEERARDEVDLLQQQLIEQEAKEGEAFAKRKVDLSEFYDERTNEITEGEQEGVREIARALTEAEELTNTQLDNMVKLAGEFGPKFGQAFADGMTDTFGKELKIDRAIAAATTGNLGLGGGDGSGLPQIQPGNKANSGGLAAFAGGGDFTVGGSGGTDSQIVAFRATPGEQVSVSPQGQGGVTVNINAPVFGVDDLDQKINMAMQGLVDQLAGA